MKQTTAKLEFSRRKLMKFGAGFLGTATLTTILGKNFVDPESAVADNNITPDEALTRLMEGNRRFVTQKSLRPNQDIDRLMEVAKEQKPFAAILGCSDSRVPAEIIFDQGFGDLFIVRNAGDVAAKEETGSLEFGTLVLGAKVLMVLGHQDCGAVLATMQGDEVPGQIAAVLTEIEPSVTKYKGQHEDKEAVKKATKSNVLYQVSRLQESPVISELIEAEKLQVVGAYYDLDTREVSLVN